MEVRQDRISARWLHDREQSLEDGVDRSRRVPDIEIDRIERLAQVPFRIVVEAAAVKAFVAVRDGPFDDVVKDVSMPIVTFRDGSDHTHPARGSGIN